MGVEIGADISHDELRELHHAVVYCTGAGSGQRLELDGAELIGNHTAVDLARWYNGHPDYARLPIDLSGERAVVIGNGNVAIDVARILTSAPEQLAATEIADPALRALRRSTVREVVVLGRRGPAEAAFTHPELVGLLSVPGLHVSADIGDRPLDGPCSPITELLACLPSAPPREGRRVVLRFDTTVTHIHGDDHVTAVTVARGGSSLRPETEDIATGLVVHSIGATVASVPGVPRGSHTQPLPNTAGRVCDTDGSPVPGVYVAGWAKRGPAGVIGTNRACALETAAAVVEDFLAGRLTTAARGRDHLDKLIAARCPNAISTAGWASIDDLERAHGAAEGRPRVKFTAAAELVQAARPTPPQVSRLPRWLGPR
ncbi:hypothetical protein ACFXNW_19945 [Nocardia sp. NPDC059180]|uniref:hypothetical protein n=1 Tax=Nocardia sp. NPDC059180 TaxID=3346761 RepID=UPI0036837FC1